MDLVWRNFYVDDLLRSFTDSCVAVEQTTQLRSLLEDAGFHLTKFFSKCVEFLESIPVEDRAQQLEARELGDDLQNKALGMLWNHVTDSFEFQVEIRRKEAT